MVCYNRAMNNHPIVGVWEVNAADAPFAWHMMTFTPHGTMLQSNPPAGNQSESDSAGQGIWRLHKKDDVEAMFVEFKADTKTGAFIGKGVITLQIKVNGNTFTGVSQAFRYNSDGVRVAGPLASPVSGTRVTFND